MLGLKIIHVNKRGLCSHSRSYLPFHHICFRFAKGIFVLFNIVTTVIQWQPTLLLMRVTFPIIPLLLPWQRDVGWKMDSGDTWNGWCGGVILCNGYGVACATLSWHLLQIFSTIPKYSPKYLLCNEGVYLVLIFRSYAQKYTRKWTHHK